MSPGIVFCIFPYRLAGSYEALAGVQIGDALVDFTGGVNEAIDMKNENVNKTKLFKVKGGGGGVRGLEEAVKG